MWPVFFKATPSLSWAAVCALGNAKHRDLYHFYMLNQDLGETDGKARLVAQGFEEVSENSLVNAGQLVVQSFNISGVVLHCQGCETGWIYLILVILEWVLEVVNTVIEYRFSILVTALAILASGSWVHRRVEERRHARERRQQQQARAQYLWGRNRRVEYGAKRRQARGAAPEEQMNEQDVRWVFVAEGLYELAAKKRKAEATRDLWSAWARLANKLRGHSWERIRKSLERIYGKTAPKKGPAARARVPF